MSKLRKQLQQARHQYQHQRYPGDLASDLLGGSDRPGRAELLAPLNPATKPAHWVRYLSLAAALAIVATAGVVLMRSEDKTDMAIHTPADPTTTLVTTPDVTRPPTDAGLQDTAPTTAPVDTGTTDVAATEEILSLVPTGIALAQETSFSLVPTLSYDEIDTTDSEDQATEQ